MMNPEFRRNLWLSFTRHKLIAMPALLGLVFLAVVLDDKQSLAVTAMSLYEISLTLFIIIVWLWGARNANQSIVEELHEKTWDQQRMSALTPWEMTWGKLFGATAINWYGGAICMLVGVPAAIYAGDGNWVLDYGVLIMGALLLHAGLIAMNMYSSQYETRLIQRGGLGWAAIAISIIFLQAARSQMSSENIIAWWGMDLTFRSLLFFSALLFSSCTVFAAWRVLSNALQVRTLPWAWPLFALILTGYVTGFALPSSEAPVWNFCIAGLMISMIMTYSTLLTEPMGLPDWNKLRVRQQRGDWRGWLQHLPLWPTTLLLAIVFALVASVPAIQPANVQFSDSAIASLPLTFALMVVRDAAIIMFFSFSPRAKRAVAVALLYIFVLDGLLPFLFKQVGLDALTFLFLPFSKNYGAVAALLVMTTHTAIAISLVVWRLQRIPRKAAA